MAAGALTVRKNNSGSLLKLMRCACAAAGTKTERLPPGVCVWGLGGAGHGRLVGDETCQHIYHPPPGQPIVKFSSTRWGAHSSVHRMTPSLLSRAQFRYRTSNPVAISD